MDNLVELRCKYCGAPLDRKDIESDSPYVTCHSCGTTQQRVDAKAYMDQMMGQIQSWISRAIPGGFSLAQQENVDPVARHNIFMSNVKPSLDVEMNEFRFAMNSVIANPLIVLPFSKGEPAKARHTSAQAFEFNAKLKSVEPLAVDAENKSRIVDAENLASAYALIVNNSKLVSDTTPGRFALMANNFKESAEAMRKCDGYEPLVGRLEGLSEVCTASDRVLNGDVLGCMSGAASGAAKLEAAKQDIMRNPRLAMMIRAVDLEISQTRTLEDVCRMVSSGTAKDPLKTLEMLNRLTSVKYPDDPNWNRLLNMGGREAELFGSVSGIVSARADGTLPICPGGGDTLFPFWHVDLRYSFTTGALFSKRSVEVTEDVLIPATFTISAEVLRNPRMGLTDIFAAAPESSLMERIRGDEDSISGGEGIGRLVDAAADNRPGSRGIVVPLSTKAEATRLVELYLQQCSSSHSKLKLSKPTVRRLVYIPCNVSDSSVQLPKSFGSLAPAVLRGQGSQNLIII